MAPFASYFAQNLPVVGNPAMGFGDDDDLAAMAALAAMSGDFGAFHRMRRGGQAAAAHMAQAHRRHMMQKCTRMFPFLMQPGGGGGGGGMGWGADESPFGADDFSAFGDTTDMGDDEEMAAEEQEIEDLGADDEDVFGADGEQFGASVQRLNKKLDKMEAKLARLQAKLDATPPSKFRKRKRLLKAIQRLKMHMKAKEQKRDKKVEIVAAKLGVPVAALTGGAAGAAALGVSAGMLARTEGEVDRSMANSMLGIRDNRTSSTGQGDEIRIPFVDATTGSPVSIVSVVAGAGLRTANIAMVTQQITYADFEIIGVDTDLKANEVLAAGTSAGEILINLLLSSLVPGGGINLFYQTENVAFGAQTTNGQLSCARTIPGIRKRSILRANNTATLAGTLRQEVANQFTITATFQAALICRVLRDDNVRAIA